MTDASTSPAVDAKRERAEQARAFLGRLAERYPNCFTRDREQVRPLAIGIQQALRAELAEDPEWKETPGWMVRQALAIYTRSFDYLTAIVERRPRINLDGSTAGEVTDQEQTHARERLDEIKAKRAARRPAKRNGGRRRQGRSQQPTAEDRTRQKLEQLQAKFARH